MKNKKFLIKMSAAGNRFLIADNRWFKHSPQKKIQAYALELEKDFGDFQRLKEVSFLERKNFIQSLIALEPSMDGLIVLNSLSKGILKCDFYNRDGSKANMCGNGACSLAVYVESTDLFCSSFQWGKNFIRPLKNFKQETAISFSAPLDPTKHVFRFKGISYSYNFISPGVPHAVLECFSDLDKEKLRPLAKRLRFKNPYKKQEGMNVSFFRIQEKNKIQAMTFERGVEDFTAACGTGALSVAFCFLQKSSSFDKVFVDMPGGTLLVQFSPALSLYSPVKWGY